MAHQTAKVSTLFNIFTKNRMNSRTLTILIFFLSVFSAGLDAQSNSAQKNPESLWKKGLELLEKGLCSSDKYRAGISEKLSWSNKEDTDFKPTVDALEGFKLIREAHELGYPAASFIYAKCMQSGIFIEENFPAGIELHRKLARAGHIPSQIHLGYELMYGRLAKDKFLFKSTGTHVSTDVEAFSWLLRAAESGDPGAQNSVAVCYQNAVGTDQNMAESLRWARLSALAGSYAGQTTLGIHYINGIAVQQDLDVSNAWLKIASEDPDGRMVKIYIDKIAPYVNKKRSAEIENQIRTSLRKPMPSPQAKPELQKR
jgi:TPR repeat protein